jgi:hypothetical protein
MKEKDIEIKIPFGGIVLTIVETETEFGVSRGGSISSNLHDHDFTFTDGEAAEFDAAIDGLESLILAHACAGLDVTSKEYVEGIQTANEAIGNNF